MSTKENFVNEIIWCYVSGGTSQRHFSKKHDSILFYSKTDKYIFNVPSDRNIKKSVMIGFPDDFSDSEKAGLKKITAGTEIIFYIKESITTTL